MTRSKREKIETVPACGLKLSVTAPGWFQRDLRLGCFKGAVQRRPVKVESGSAIQNIRVHVALEAISHMAIERISDLRFLVHGTGNSDEGFFERRVFTRS